MSPPPSPPPLISTRAALVVLLGLLCGMVAAVLTFLAAKNGPAAVLVGLGAFGGGISFFHRFIEG